MEQTSQPKIKHRTFRYKTHLDWSGGRAGVLSGSEKPSFRVASPPEFKGEPGVWTPEDLFVASVEICTMTTFLSFAERLGIPPVSYSSDAEGTLEFVHGRYEFTKIVVRPTIVAPSADAVVQIEKALHDSHEHCLIANSMRSHISVEPTILLQEVEAPAPAYD